MDSAQSCVASIVLRGPRASYLVPALAEAGQEPRDRAETGQVQESMSLGPNKVTKTLKEDSKFPLPSAQTWQSRPTSC